MNRLQALLWLGLAAGCVSVPDEGDNPLLRGGAKPEFSRSQLDKINFQLLWESSLPGKRLKGLWLIDDALYTVSADHQLYAIGLDDGVVRWVYDVGDEVSFAPAVYLYKRDEVTGLSAYDELFVVSKDRLLCLDKQIGALNWSAVLPFAVASPPSASETHVYLGSWDDRIYAISKTKRIESWRFRTDRDVTATAVYGGRTTPAVYFASEDGTVYAADPVKGRLPGAWSFSTDGPVLANLVFDQKMVYVGSSDFNLYQIGAEDGQLNWRVPLGAPVTTSPLVVGNTVYAVADGQFLYAIHRVKDLGAEEGKFFAGDVKWRFPQGVQVLAVGRENVYVVDSARNISALDHESGDPLWKYSFKDVRFFCSNDHNPGDRVDEKKGRAGIVVLGYANGWIFALKEKPKF